MLKNIKRSLADLLGEEYMEAVKNCAVELYDLAPEKADILADGRIDFCNDDFIEIQNELAEQIGKKLLPGFKNDNLGAATLSFSKATNSKAAPLGGLGAFRVGEDGRLYLTAKSEHYHTSLGHRFPGYGLINHLNELGVPNATHNNTRGYVTRLLERELVRCVNGISRNDTQKVNEIISSKEPKVLNRVINLETGSLAVEAGIKMMLNRFYKADEQHINSQFSGKIPVFLVIADNLDGRKANYHGTTIFAQMMRDMWPEIYNLCKENDILRIEGVRINDLEDFKRKINTFNQGKYKTAGFLHEIILMNYGGIKLDKEYLQETYKLCKQFNTPVLIDEIQSCMWIEGMFLFRHYELIPDFVVIGKGFPGGEYPASKVITTYEMDNLEQFGALVTNGQEELASLAYLITMEFAQENGQHIRQSGEYLESIMDEMRRKYPDIITKTEGMGHLQAIHFSSGEAAAWFARELNDACIDISTQSYKNNSSHPPAAIIKPPIVMTKKTMDIMRLNMEGLLKSMSAQSASG